MQLPRTEWARVHAPTAHLHVHQISQGEGKKLAMGRGREEEGGRGGGGGGALEVILWFINLTSCKPKYLFSEVALKYNSLFKGGMNLFVSVSHFRP